MKQPCGGVGELLVVVGGGAAGVYAAVRAKTIAPHLDVVVVEKAKLLSKVLFILFSIFVSVVRKFISYFLGFDCCCCFVGFLCRSKFLEVGVAMSLMDTVTTVR